MDYAIRADDFILANKRQSLFEDRSIASFHLAILNPPYYKLQKESVHARAMEHVVHGQPNIYALFMASAADLLLPQGEMVVITPRSYFNGLYFKRFRKWFFERMAARQIHVFGSRREAFEKDDVLQENVILLAEKSGKPKKVVLTTSAGRDLHDACRRVVPYDKVIDPNDGDRVVRVTTDDFESDIVEVVDSLPHRFRDRGYEISTGPVVSFRAVEFLRKERTEDTAPLLWMHNVRPFVTRFPPKSNKPAHMTVGDGSKRMLLPARRYILLKRFTAKEEKRRVVAGIMEAADSYSEWVGLENHLNYVYLKSGEWTRAEVFGLAAFFNSVLVDRYFRAISGNTQVNATEIRVMPVPDQSMLARIGEEVAREDDRAPCRIERIVGQALRLPSPLVEQLCKAAQ